MSNTTILSEEAKKLGFKPPVHSGIPEIPAATNVVGYFNPNLYPVHISISELNLSFTLKNRGDYIVDKTGRKINDPVFERCVGTSMLAREMSDAPIQVVALRRNPTVTPTGPYGFGGLNDSKKATPENTAPRTPEVRPSGGVNPVGAFSRAQAERLGIVKSVRGMSEDAGVTDTDKGLAPNIQEALDISRTTPREPRKNAAVVPPTALAESPQQQAIVDALSRSAAQPIHENPLDLLTEEVVDEPAPVVAVPPVVSTEPAAPVYAELPDPSVEPAYSPDSQLGDAKRFVCFVDNKAFKYRSELDRYAKKKYPDTHAKIMESYPLK